MLTILPYANAPRIKDTAMTVAGLTMAATPLALWLAPNPASFYVVLATCGVAYLVIVALAWLDANGAQPPRQEER